MMNISVREMKKSDAELIVNYFVDVDYNFLNDMVQIKTNIK